MKLSIQSNFHFWIWISIENRERTSSSTVNTSTQNETADKTTKGKRNINRFLLEIKRNCLLVTEERNKYAVEICKRIRDKLDGSDPDPLIQSSISEQVRKKSLIIENISYIRLVGSLYYSWSHWYWKFSHTLWRMDIMGMRRSINYHFGLHKTDKQKSTIHEGRIKRNKKIILLRIKFCKLKRLNMRPGRDLFFLGSYLFCDQSVKVRMHIFLFFAIIEYLSLSYFKKRNK